MEREFTIDITDLWEGQAVKDEISEMVSEYISDRTGFCHKGFSFDVTIHVTNIDYDEEE